MDTVARLHAGQSTQAVAAAGADTLSSTWAEVVFTIPLRRLQLRLLLLLEAEAAAVAKIGATVTVD